jgi:hypothetical protein
MKDTMGINPFATPMSTKESGSMKVFSGRSEYERMNGLSSAGIPDRIVTDKVLEDFLLGMLGIILILIDTRLFKLMLY